MKQLFSVFLALTAFSVAQPLLAQESNLPQTLTLDEAIKGAIERNYTVRQAANTTRRSDIEVTRSKDNAWLPTANANGRWGYEYSLTPLSERTRRLIVPGDSLAGTTTQTQTIIAPASSQSLSWSVGANYNIYNGGADIARIRAAEASRDAAQSTQTWTRQDIAYSVTSAYLNVLRTGELVDQARKTLAEGLAQFELIHGKYQAGVVPIGQVYQQQAVVGQDSLSLIQAINNNENAKADVLFLLNVPPTDFNQYSFSVRGIDTGVASKPKSDTVLPLAAIDAAVRNRPDIVAQQQTIQAAIDRIDMTRAALLPGLDASAGISGAGSNSDLSKIHVSNGLSVGLALNIPIFDAMQTRLLVQEQEVDIENQRITLEQMMQQIRGDATKAVNNLHAASEALSASETALTAANENLRLATERLRVGAGTQVDVVIAESTVEGARTNYVNAKFNYVLAQRQLGYTLGPWNY